MNDSFNKLNSLHPLLIQDATKAYNEAVLATPKGVHPIITQGLRTFEESNILYAQGRTAPGSIVTNAKAGSSYHNYGLAVDFCLFVGGKLIWKVDENWMTVVNIFKKYGFSWGGDWKSLKDNPHLEKNFGYNWRQLLFKYHTQDFIEGTEYVNI